MAEIWLGRLEGPGSFQKRVVVKRIRPSLIRQVQSGGRQVEMFVREAELLARLEHAHIVRVLEFGVEPARRPGEPDEYFIVMEHLEGLALRDLALRSWQAGRPLPVELVVRFVADACLGLAHAHGLRDAQGKPTNLVHRDVSPDNIFVTRPGVTKLLDFGIAKRDDSGTLTTTGELKGKVPYMAPEQLRAERLDARTDVWAVGVVLYWLLTGRRPFDGPNDVFTMKAILDDAPRPVRDLNPEVPPLLADAVLACLDKDPARRFGSAAALHDTLSLLLLGLAGTPPDASELVRATEALPPATFETTPDLAARCVQRWPDTPVTPVEEPRTLAPDDPTVDHTVDVPRAQFRAVPVRAVPFDGPSTSIGGPDGLGVDDEPATLPPAFAVASTAEGLPVAPAARPAAWRERLVPGGGIAVPPTTAEGNAEPARASVSAPGPVPSPATPRGAPPGGATSAALDEQGGVMHVLPSAFADDSNTSAPRAEPPPSAAARHAGVEPVRATTADAPSARSSSSTTPPQPPSPVSRPTTRSTVKASPRTSAERRRSRALVVAVVVAAAVVGALGVLVARPTSASLLGVRPNEPPVPARGPAPDAAVGAQ
jgi:serine/threonine-protein kinase